MKMIPDNMRDDVIEFAVKMNEVMIEKNKERPTPDSYMQSEIDKLNDELINQFDLMQDFILNAMEDLVKKRAIHVANYCMIIYNKLNLNNEKDAD